MTRVVFAAFLFAVAPGCGGESAPVVEITDERAFSPERTAVSVGDTVTWRNVSSESHTVTAVQNALPDGADYFASGGFGEESDAERNLAEGLIGEGEEFVVTFDEPGTYPYYCIPHRDQGMRGEIVVEP